MNLIRRAHSPPRAGYKRAYFCPETTIYHYLDNLSQRRSSSDMMSMRSCSSTYTFQSTRSRRRISWSVRTKVRLFPVTPRLSFATAIQVGQTHFHVFIPSNAGRPRGRSLPIRSPRVTRGAVVLRGNSWERGVQARPQQTVTDTRPRASGIRRSPASLGFKPAAGGPKSLWDRDPCRRRNRARRRWAIRVLQMRNYGCQNT
ncbi:hypothetical protein BV22DRAFT_814544 [Leucogyrophana mollusca]|uniref:Uncharacterized protein n=1 Tax=Leucogyrophana mollusca TaxID=85980 RepID=A0ACB8B5W8_9AGAM|nr:hypothetical protein BV22DRAFT_814544 [Leucogyrophana mollusca]